MMSWNSIEYDMSVNYTVLQHSAGTPHSPA